MTTSDAIMWTFTVVVAVLFVAAMVQMVRELPERIRQRSEELMNQEYGRRFRPKDWKP